MKTSLPQQVQAAAALVLWLALVGRAPAEGLNIADLIGQFSETSMSNTVRDLEALPSRAVGKEGNEQAAAYLHARLSKIPGLRVEPLQAPLRNVIATLSGTDTNAGALYVVGAHYDAYDAKRERVPGAMDDAVGVSIVLEMARILGPRRFRSTVVFACWNGEECGLLGSKAFVERLGREGKTVALYLNYDSTGYDPAGRRVLDVIANRSADGAKRVLLENNRKYGIGFTITENRHTCGGDYVPFAEAGFPFINTHQEEHGPHYHTAQDTISRVTFPYALNNGQLGLSVLAALLQAADASKGPVNPEVAK